MSSGSQYENLEKVAAVLAKVSSKFEFTGGATIILYVDSLIQDELRITKDVDCVIDINSRAEYYQLSEQLRAIGLEECLGKNEPICRWQYQDQIIDIMPCEPSILGFSNRWYAEGIEQAISTVLPSGREILIFSPLHLLASKIEAFSGRGQSFIFSKDIEDIITLLDGCQDLAQEFDTEEGELKSFVSEWFVDNREELKDAAYNFSLSGNSRREKLILNIIDKFAQGL